MAEREGFEPPIALRLCLISSQVHSTGLCHLSACYLVYFESLTCLGVFTIFTPNHPVSVLVSLLSLKIDQAIDRRGLVFRAEMGVPHDHLKRPVPEQLCNRAQIDSGHNKSTGKGMAVAMPRVIRHLRLIEGRREP